MAKLKKDHDINIRQMFLDLQKTMKSELQTLRRNIKHEPTKGEGSEVVWIKFFQNYLPKRYSVAKAIIIDYEGKTSDAIDVVIYDSQYTPFILNENGVKYIPAESVYAIFEAKQEISKQFLEYASAKVLSVRQLIRTTAPVIDKGIVKPAPQLFNILGGFLCLENRWKSSISSNKAFKDAITVSTELKIIDIGCVLNDRSFKTVVDLTDHLNPKVDISFSTVEETLIYFFLKLVAELQKLGTVRPIDLNKYIDQLESQ
jgi:hypothetical protein